jgi:hypothetical protein
VPLLGKNDERRHALPRKRDREWARGELNPHVLTDTRT